MSGGYLSGLYTLLIQRLLIFVFFLSIVPAVYSQNAWRLRADEIIQHTDSLAVLSQRTFHLTKIIGDDRSFRETWHYTMSDGRVAVFHVRYTIDSVEYSEVYYSDRDNLLCAEFYETIYDSWNEDNVRWGEVHYFSNSLLMQYVRLGKEKNNWGNGMAVQHRYEQRKFELEKNLRW